MNKEYRKMRKFMRNVMKSASHQHHAINEDSDVEQRRGKLREPLLA
jgi:hypothetical protein